VFGYVNTRLVNEWDQMMSFKTRRYLSTLEEFSKESHELSEEEMNIYSELERAMRNYGSDLTRPPAFFNQDDAKRLENILVQSVYT